MYGIYINLGGIMLAKIGKKTKHCLVSATCGIFFKGWIHTESTDGRDGEGRKWVDGGQSYIFDEIVEHWVEKCSDLDLVQHKDCSYEYWIA